MKLLEEILKGDKISPPVKPAPPTARRPDTMPVYGPIQAKTPPPQLPPPKPKPPPPQLPPSSPPVKPVPPNAMRLDTTLVYGPIQAKTPPLQLPPKPKRPPPCFPPTVTSENICDDDTGGASSSTSELKPVGEMSKSMLVSGSQPRSDWQ